MKITTIVISSCCITSILLVFFPSIQRMFVESPLVTKGYFLPFIFGATAGVIFGLWLSKLRETEFTVLRSHDMLDARRDKGMLELKNEIAMRKRIEEDLRNNEKSLKESQLISKIGHLELVFATGKFDWSDETYRIWGMSPQEAKATYAGFLEKVHPEDTRKVEGIFKASGDKHAEHLIEHRILLEDKTEKWVLEKGYTEYNEDGEPVRLVGTVQDITEIKLLRGILPICMYCKDIRNSEGEFEKVEAYVHRNSGVDFSHTICPTCMQEHYTEED